MYHNRSLLKLAIVCFTVALITLMIWFQSTQAQSVNMCPDFDEITRLELRGYGLRELGYPRGTRLLFDNPEIVQPFVAHFGDVNWFDNKYYTEGQTDAVGYPDLIIEFFVDTDGQFDYYAALYQNQNVDKELLPATWSYQRRFADGDIHNHPDCGWFRLQWSEIYKLLDG